MIRFPYEPFLVRGTRSGSFTTVYRPQIPIRIHGPAGSDDDQGLVDTGADDTLLPDRFIRQLGVSIAPGDHSIMLGIEGSMMLVRYGMVDLEIPGRGGGLRWSARVGFHAGPRIVFGLGASSNPSPPASTAEAATSRSRPAARP